MDSKTNESIFLLEHKAKKLSIIHFFCSNLRIGKTFLQIEKRTNVCVGNVPNRKKEEKRSISKNHNITKPLNVIFFHRSLNSHHSKRK